VSNKSSIDLYGKESWEKLYQARDPRLLDKFEYIDYNFLLIKNIFIKIFNRYAPKSVLEVGCGNSIWLPYLAKSNKIQIAGIDYSREGCNLLLENLKKTKVEGKIFCEDIFQSDPRIIGRYDLVYSLGVVEHFSEPKEIICKLTEFVNTEGLLFTEIPNLKNSIHQLLVWIWQPEILKKHQKISKEELEKIYFELGLEIIESKYLGFFSLSIVAWDNNDRWPKINKIVLPLIKKIVRIVDIILFKLKINSGISFFAPYIYIVGRKK